MPRNNKNDHDNASDQDDNCSDIHSIEGTMHTALGPRLNIKTVFPGMDFHCKDNMVVRPPYLYNGNSYTSKTHLLSLQLEFLDW